MAKLGIAKGMRKVLFERGYNVSDNRIWTKKRLARLMCVQPDFEAQKTLLELLIEKRNHIALFLPRFHCELNQIEQYWMHGKQEYKDRNMFLEPVSKFEANVDECLNKIDEQLAHRCAKHARKYLNAYAKGNTTQQAVELVKKMAKQQSKHRGAPELQ